jgi:hypothetical protein
MGGFALSSNTLWTTQELALIDRYVAEEITLAELTAAIPYRSMRGIRKKAARAARRFTGSHEVTPLERDDPGETDGDFALYCRRARIGSEMLLARIAATGRVFA